MGNSRGRNRRYTNQGLKLTRAIIETLEDRRLLSWTAPQLDTKFNTTGRSSTNAQIPDAYVAQVLGIIKQE